MSHRRGGAAAAAGLVLLLAYLYRGLASGSAILTDEGVWPYVRAHEYLREFGAGRLPQTFPDALRGGGYAFPYFYPPLSQYVAAVSAASTGDVVHGVHLAFALSMGLSALTMLWAMRRVGSGVAAAALAAVFYVSFPYRWVVVFGRGALAEAWTFVWYPLVLAGAWELWRGRRMPWWLPLAIGALLLTHPVMALYFAAALAFALLLCWPHRVAPGPGRLVLSVALGAALAAWYLVPSQADLHCVLAANPAVMWAAPATVSQIHVAPAQALGLAGLSRGYGVNIGMIQLALPVLAAVAPRLTRRRGALPDLAIACLLVWLLLLVVVVWPAPFFALLPARFAYIQFPWRLLGLTGLLASLSLGLLADGLPSAALAGLALLIGVLDVVSAPPAVVRHTSEMTSTAILSLPRSAGDSGYTVQAEYLPKTADPGSLAQDVAAGPVASPGIEVRHWSGATAPSADVRATRPGAVILPIVAYNFYRVTVDGAPAATRDTAGRLVVGVPAGEHRIAIERRLTPTSWIGLAITLCGILGLVLLARARGAP